MGADVVDGIAKCGITLSPVVVVQVTVQEGWQNEWIIRGWKRKVTKKNDGSTTFDLIASGEKQVVGYIRIEQARKRTCLPY